MNNRNAENYEAKLASCEANITRWEAEEKVIAKQGISLLKRLGIIEPSTIHNDALELDRRRWLVPPTLVHLELDQLLNQMDRTGGGPVRSAGTSSRVDAASGVRPPTRPRYRLPVFQGVTRP